LLLGGGDGIYRADLREMRVVGGDEGCDVFVHFFLRGLGGLLLDSLLVVVAGEVCVAYIDH